jgi:hypothetical protein
MLGEKANWVCNVRAARGKVTIRHGRREEVWLEEIAVDRRAPVLKAYLQRAPNARAHVPVDKDSPLAEFERLAHRFPVFRVTASPHYPSHRRSRERLALDTDSHTIVEPASSEGDGGVREPVR